MGSHPNIDMDNFPKQGRNLGKKVKIVFNFDTSRFLWGICIRDDIEAPFTTLFYVRQGKGAGIGRIIDATECQYQPQPASSDDKEEDIDFIRNTDDTKTISN